MTEPSYRPDRRIPPDRRKEDYDKLDKKIEEFKADLLSRLERFIRKALFAFAIIGITSAIGLLGFGLALRAVQKAREDFIRDSCVAQNKRHDKTISAFNEAAAAAMKKYPTRAAEIRDSVNTNLGIIDALAPKQNCEQLVRVANGDQDPPPPVVTTPKRKEHP